MCGRSTVLCSHDRSISFLVSSVKIVLRTIFVRQGSEKPNKAQSFLQSWRVYTNSTFHMMSVKLSVLSVPTNRQNLSVCRSKHPKPRLITKSKAVGFVGADKPTEFVGLSVCRFVGQASKA